MLTITRARQGSTTWPGSGENRLEVPVVGDTKTEVGNLVEAIRRTAEGEGALTRPGVAEIEQQVDAVVRLTKNAVVGREGARLVESARACSANRDNKIEIVQAARLQGAVGRFEFALRQLGFLDA